MSKDLFGFPTEDDLERDMQKADDAAAEELSDRVGSEPHETEEIDLDDVTPGDIGAASDDEADKLSRAEKKRERLALMDELKAEREKNVEMTDRLARLETMAQQFQRTQQQPAQPQVDPIQQKIDHAYEQMNQLQQQAQYRVQEASNGGRAITNEEEKDFLTRRQRLDQYTKELAAMKVNRDSGIGPQDPNAAGRAIIQANYKDVYENPQAVKYAEATYNQRRALGEPDGHDLLGSVMQETRQRFNLKAGPRGAPTKAMQQKYAGAGAGGAGGRQSGPSRVIRMTPELKAIAETNYAHLNISEKEKHARWAKEFGPQFLAEESKARR